MADRFYRVDVQKDYAKAGPTDFVELLPAAEGHGLCVRKCTVEILFDAITGGEMMHVTGPTGSGKTSLIEALCWPGNFAALCAALKRDLKPLRVYRIKMVVFETPGELYHRRALRGGTTFDEESRIVQALRDSARQRDGYVLIWLEEIGRVMSDTIQGGLLTLMSRDNIVLPDETRIDGRQIAWIADSNYQAEQEATHTLATFDDAFKRRFTRHLTLSYLPPESEMQVLRHILRNEKVEEGSLARVVQLGSAIRRQRAEGKLQSVPPPTIYGYLSFVRLSRSLPELSLYDVARTTLLGNANRDDMNLLPGIFNEVFGVGAADVEDHAMAGGLL